VKITAASHVSTPQARVFAALIDPGVLRRSIPGCQSLVAVSAADPVGNVVYEATVQIGVAGLKGTYSGTATIRERQPPDRLTLAFEGKGGPGFVRGVADIRLSPDDGGTRVTCEADVQVGGLIAAVGSRLVEAAARKVADDFFRQLASEIVQEPSGPPGRI
jgi:carbon monoxide dehydrogenase subunit G